MIRSDAPVWHGGNKRLRFQPIPRHGRAEQNVIDARVGIFHAVKICPGDVARFVAGAGGGDGIAVALGGAGVGELVFAVTDDGFGGGGVFGGLT